MRLDSIESGAAHSGSVSPPAAPLLTMDSMNGKKAFFETMRTKYANARIQPAVMEKKIELLWKGLSQTQKEQFIIKSAKENKVPQKSPEKRHITQVLDPNRSKRIPELRRSDNIKAIAKVLDLRSDAQKPSRYADTIKNRMQAYTIEANVAFNRSPPRKASAHFLSSAQQLRLAADSVKAQLEARRLKFKAPEAPSEAPRPVRTVASSKVIFRSPFTAQGINRTSPPIPKPPSHQNPQKPDSEATRLSQNSRRILKRRAVLVNRSTAPQPQMPYKEACQQYYSALSQATLMNSVEQPCLLTVAPIVEGFHITREYTFQDLL